MYGKQITESTLQERKETASKKLNFQIISDSQQEKTLHHESM